MSQTPPRSAFPLPPEPCFYAYQNTPRRDRVQEPPPIPELPLKRQIKRGIFPSLSTGRDLKAVHIVWARALQVDVWGCRR